MNERIKELALQSEVLYDDGEYLEQDLAALQKFAQLVAQECAKICEKYAEAFDILENRNEPTDFFTGGVKSGSRRNAVAIKKHFGVEE